MNYRYEVHYTRVWWVPVYRWAVNQICKHIPANPDESRIERFIMKYGTKQVLVHKPC